MWIVKITLSFSKPKDGKDGKEAYKHKKMHKHTQMYVNQGEGEANKGPMSRMPNKHVKGKVK